MFAVMHNAILHSALIKISANIAPLIPCILDLSKRFFSFNKTPCDTEYTPRNGPFPVSKYNLNDTRYNIPSFQINSLLEKRW